MTMIEPSTPFAELVTAFVKVEMERVLTRGAP